MHPKLCKIFCNTWNSQSTFVNKIILFYHCRQQLSIDKYSISTKKCHDSEENILSNEWYSQIVLWNEGWIKNEDVCHRNEYVTWIKW